MHRKLKVSIITIAALLLITACSTQKLQTTRLDKAETYIIQAEQALTIQKMRIATNNMGTANAYLDTLKDNLKFLKKPEVKRYHLLRARAKKLASRIVL